MRHTRTVLSIAAVAALGAGCAQPQVSWLDNGVPYYDHPEQTWHYQFVYHPNSQVYFEPYTKTYYWYGNGEWHSGSDIPQELRPLDDRIARIVKLQDFEPFNSHPFVVAQHPPSIHMWHEGFDARGDYGDLMVAGTETEHVDAPE